MRNERCDMENEFVRKEMQVYTAIPAAYPDAQAH